MIVATQNRHHAGFTLIELLISSVLMAGILTAGYLCLQGGVASREMIEARADTVQRARVAMRLITADLRAATSLSTETEFVGVSRMLDQVEADSIDFGTHNYIPRRPGESDFCETSYFVDKGSDGGFSLWRRRDPTRDSEPLSGGTREEIAEGIAGLRFEYYDGFDWYDDWGSSQSQPQTQAQNQLGAGQNQSRQAATGQGTGQGMLGTFSSTAFYGLPDAVRITLLFAPTDDDSKTPSGSDSQSAIGPLSFQTVVHLNLVDKPTPSMAGGGMTNTPTGASSGRSSSGGSR